MIFRFKICASVRVHTIFSQGRKERPKHRLLVRVEPRRFRV